MTFYLSPDKADLESVEIEVFDKFIAQVAAIDPEAIDPEDGSIIGRNAATGELEPTATRTTGYFGDPSAAVQGWFHPQPEDTELQLDAPEQSGVEVVAHLNPWPQLIPAAGGEGQEAPPLPEWVQPLGAHDAYPLGMMVTHEGLDYRSTIAANIWPPSPESNFWDAVPPLPPQPWRQPTGSADSYNIGDRVTHTAANRDETLWESLINGNATEPGTDGSPGQWFDRWWRPLAELSTEPVEWVQPMPGTAAMPYDLDAVVLFEGERYKSIVQLNVWSPAGPGAFGWEPMPD